MGFRADLRRGLAVRAGANGSRRHRAAMRSPRCRSPSPRPIPPPSRRSKPPASRRSARRSRCRALRWHGAWGGFRRPPRSRARPRSRVAAIVRAAAALFGKARPAGAGGQRRCARVRSQPARLQDWRDGSRAADSASPKCRSPSRTSVTPVLRRACAPPWSASRSQRRGASPRISSRCCASGSRASCCPRPSKRSRSRARRSPSREPQPRTAPRRQCSRRPFRCSIACAHGWARTP